jgi:hypothetical protein
MKQIAVRTTNVAVTMCACVTVVHYSCVFTYTDDANVPNGGVDDFHLVSFENIATIMNVVF